MPHNGKRVTFRYELILPTSLIGGAVGYAKVVYHAPPGVNATLKPLNSDTLIVLMGAAGSYLLLWKEGHVNRMLDSHETFDFSGFELTIEDGTRYIIERDTIGEVYIGQSPYIPYTGGHLARILSPDGSRVEFIRENGQLTDIQYYSPLGDRDAALHFDFDAQNRIVAAYEPAHQDERGQPNGPPAFKYDYSAAGNLIKVHKLHDDTDPAQPIYRTTQYAYELDDHPHYITDIIDPNGDSAIQTSYDKAGRVQKLTDPMGSSVRFTHNITDRTEIVHDQNGQPTRQVYDEHGNIVLRINAMGHTIRQEFNEQNYLIARTDALGHTWRYAYDEKGHQVSSSDPLGNTVSNVYDEAGNVTATINAMGYRVDSEYNEANRVTAVRSELGGGCVYERDFNGQIKGIYLEPAPSTQQLKKKQPATKQKQEPIKTVSANYDKSGSLSGLESVFDVVSVLSYGRNGFLMTDGYIWEDPDNAGHTIRVISTNSYDASGRVVEKKDALGNRIQMEYDMRSKLVRKVDALDNVTEYVYNRAGRQLAALYPDGTVMKQVFDAAGRVVYATLDVPGQPDSGIYQEYDPEGRPIHSKELENIVIELDHENLTTTYVSSERVIRTSDRVYDAAGRMISQSWSDGGTVQYEFDDANRMTAYIDEFGQRTTYAYNEEGQVIQVVDADGRIIRHEYDKAGRKTKTTAHNGAVYTLKHDEKALPAEETTYGGQVKRYQYDLEGRLQSVTLPGDRHTAYEYDAYGNLRSIQDVMGRSTRMYYDEFHRQTRKILPMGEQMRYTYDKHHRLKTVTDFKGRVTTLEYDDLGRLCAYTTRHLDQQRQVRYEFDRAGRIVRIHEPEGVTRYEYDHRGDLVAVHTPQGTIHYAYDPHSGLRTRTWTDQSETAFTYDIAGRLKTVSVVKRNGVLLAEPEITIYEYSPVGNCSALILGNGIRTDFTYDDLNLLHKVRHTDAEGKLLGAYTYTRKPNGAIERVADVHKIWGDQQTSYQANEVAFTYDEVNQLTREEVVSPEVGRQYSVDYTYDKVGNRLSRTVSANGTLLDTTYEYNANDQLIRESTTKELTALPLQYQPGSKPRFRELPSAASSVGFYLAYLGLLAAGLGGWFAHGLRPMPGYRRRWRRGFMALSALLAFACGILGAPFEALANEAGLYRQLSTSNWGREDTVINYAYDANGALIRQEVVGPDAKVMQYSYNLENRLAQLEVTYQRDGDQFLERTTYVYSAFGIQAGYDHEYYVNDVSQGSEKVRYLIDPYNHTGFEQVYEEYVNDQARPTVTYTIGDTILAQTTRDGEISQRTYLLQDGQNSTRMLSDQQGGISARYRYDAFGINLEEKTNANSPSTTSMRFNTEKFDPHAQHYNLRARYYNPWNGRFNRRDPYEGRLDDPQSLHKYNYAHADPVNLTDPSGLAACIVDQVIGMFIKTMTVLTIAMQWFLMALFVLSGDFSIRGFLEELVNPETWKEAIQSMVTDLIQGLVPVLLAMMLGPWAGILMTYASLFFAFNSMKYQFTMFVKWYKDQIQNLEREYAISVIQSILSSVMSSLLWYIKRYAKPWCFVAGTFVLANTGLTPIEELKPGDRVITPDYQEQVHKTRVDPATWKQVHLRIADGQGVSSEIHGLRSPDWFEQTGTQLGGMIWYENEELGIAAWAEVTSIQPCPEIDEGPGCVILTTYINIADELLEVTLDDDERFQSTVNHPIYSASRHAWIQAKNLIIGECVKTLGGIARVAETEHLTKVATVFNLEVESDHCYYITKSFVLSHNSYTKPAANNVDNIPNRPISMGEALTRANNFLDPNLPIRSIDGPTGVQFIQQTTDARGNAITRRVGFDVNPTSSHVQQLGPHLNLQTQINGKPVRTGALADPHTPIIPSTVRPGDF